MYSRFDPRRMRDERVSRVQKFYATTLDDVAKAPGSLHLDCRGCRHHMAVDVKGLAMRFGGFLNLGMIKGRARCSRCGRRDADVLFHDHTLRGDKGWWPHAPMGR